MIACQILVHTKNIQIGVMVAQWLAVHGISNCALLVGAITVARAAARHLGTQGLSAVVVVGQH